MLKATKKRLRLVLEW